MNEGMTVVDACEEVSIPRSTYYDFIKNKPELLLNIKRLLKQMLWNSSE